MDHLLVWNFPLTLLPSPPCPQLPAHVASFAPSSDDILRLATNPTDGSPTDSIKASCMLAVGDRVLGDVIYEGSGTNRTKGGG